MSRYFQWMVALLVCSVGVIAILLTETVWSFLLAIAGLVFLLWHVKRGLTKLGRRADPNFDKIWQFCIMTILAFSLTVVSDWKFWLCLAGWILINFLMIRGLVKRTEASMSCSLENTGVGQSQTAKDHSS